MEPTFTQLRNRIKYVEALRTTQNTKIGFGWMNECGQCAVGLILRKFEITKDTILAPLICQPFAPFSPFANVLIGLTGFTPREHKGISEHRNFWRERLKISEVLGLNYLQIQEISNLFEGCIGSKRKELSKMLLPKELARWFEAKYVTPYLWMIEKHYPIIKAKVVKELQLQEA